MSQENKSAKAAKEAAAQARAEAAKLEQGRQRKIRLIGGAVVVLVMAGLIAIPLVSGKNKGPVTNGNAALPAGVTSKTYGVKVGPAWTAANADAIPMLQIWEDFQCPACGQFEKSSGSALKALIDAGKVRVEYRPTIFLDSNLSAQNTAAGNPNSSMLATIAFVCAVDASKAEEFHAGVFAAQPTPEGAGYSSDALTAIAQSSGITGDAFKTWNDCFSSNKYESWVNNSFDLFSKEGVSSTPTGLLNGTELKGDVMFDPTKLTAAIQAATKS